MALIKSNLPYDDALIISRLQQKELRPLKPSTIRLSQTFSPIARISLDPFIDQLPIKIGLELNLLGSRIVNCRIDRGFLFQDLEQSLSNLNFPEALLAIARLNQGSPIFNQMALSLALEEMFTQVVSEERLGMRCFMMEFSRIFHHWQVIKNILICLNHEGLVDIALAAESLMKAPHDLLGRIWSAKSCPTAMLAFSDLQEMVEVIESLARELESNVSFDPHLRQLLRKKAFITASMASSFGLTGVYLRANRNNYDIRRENAKLGYKAPPKTELAEGGDAWARFILRVREILASIEWIKGYSWLAGEAPSNVAPLVENFNIDATFASLPFAFGEVDGPEGDTKVSIFHDRPHHKLIYRVRTPAFFIAQAIPHLIAQSDINDLPLILYSLGIRADEIDK